MKALSKDQKVAMLVVPVLLFGVLGVSEVFAHGNHRGPLSEEEREALEEARELRAEGNHEEAKEVLEEAGLLEFLKPGRAHLPELREAIRKAIDEDDYEAFEEATEGTFLEEYVDEDIFTILVEAHELREAGKFEEARELLQDNDIKPRLMMRHNMHHLHAHWKGNTSD